MNVYGFYLKVVRRIRTNKLLCRMIYGFNPPPAFWGQYWDWTTLTLHNCLKSYVKPETKLLDMGCGPYAVLSRYAKIKLHCRNIIAADYCPELITFAGYNDPENGINYIYSDLFANIHSRSNLISFNAPYLESDKGKRKGLFPDDLSQKRFCGGTQGIDTIKNFLQDAPQYIEKAGILMLGVNLFHINKELVESTIYLAGYKVISIRYNPLTKACVYILKEK
jgi:methylase of polypeptide subunit release factors